MSDSSLSVFNTQEHFCFFCRQLISYVVPGITFKCVCLLPSIQGAVVASVAGKDVEESKRETAEVESKIASSLVTTLSTAASGAAAPLLGSGATVLASVDDKSFVVRVWVFGCVYIPVAHVLVSNDRALVRCRFPSMSLHRDVVVYLTFRHPPVDLLTC
jgi:hypothetical protein